MESFISYSTLPGDEGLLGRTRNNVLSAFPEQFGNPMLGVRRTILHAGLIAACEKYGVEIKWDHHCTGFEQEKTSVTATFANGEIVTGSFLIGCDGLHSIIRIGLFGRETASYTGLTQVSGKYAVHSQNEATEVLFRRVVSAQSQPVSAIPLP